MKRLLFILCIFLFIFISIGLVALPLILSLVFNSWYWLILYSIHITTIIFIAIACKFAPEEIEDRTHV